MKKVIIFISLIIMLILPLKLNAEIVISSLLFNGDKKEAKIGEQINYELTLKTVGLDKNLGIAAISIEIEYDENVVSPGILLSPNFTSRIIKKENKHYIEAEVIPGKTNNHCALGYLYCGEYTVKIPFIIKNTEATNTNIVVNKVNLGLLNIDKLDESILENIEDISDLDMISVLTKDISKTSTINIKKDTSIEQVPIEQKSNNTYLRTLEIYNYKIDFEKEKREYEIYVAKNVNKLEISASVDHPDSTYKIIGNDDLSRNENKVIIEVTASDKTVENYIINVKQKEEENPVVESLDKENQNIEINSDKKILKLMGAIFGGILFLIILIIIINRKKKQAINKMFDEL